MSEIYYHIHNKGYPNNEHGHMAPVKIVRETNFDDPTYEFRVESKFRKFKSFIIRLFLPIIGSAICYFRFNPKYKNKHMIKKHRKEIRNGFMTISNHVFDWDNVVLRNIYKFRKSEMPIWKEGADSSLGELFRLSGGIPVPGYTKSIFRCFSALEQVIKDKGWLHVYPEAACWNFYSPVREFKPGTFRIAYDYNIPVFPVAFSFRKPTGLFKLWKKHEPCVNVSVGEPLYADTTLDRQPGIEDLCRRVHEAVVKLIGFKDENENEEFKKKYSYYEYKNPYLSQYEKFRAKKGK